MGPRYKESIWAFTFHPGIFQIGVEKESFPPLSEVWGYGLRTYIILWGGDIKFNPVRKPKMGNTETSIVNESMDPFLCSCCGSISQRMLYFFKLDQIGCNVLEVQSVRCYKVKASSFISSYFKIQTNFTFVVFILNNLSLHAVKWPLIDWFVTLWQKCVKYNHYFIKKFPMTEIIAN